MKTSVLVLVASTLFLAICVPIAARADFPVCQSSGRDHNPVVAYNSQSHEYLVIWIQSTSPDIGPLMGQRISESGSAVGSAFTIVSFVSGTASVVYNIAQNEYLVAYMSGIAPDIGISGQRLSASGSKVGTAVVYMSIGQRPKLLYNSLAGSYLLIGLNGDLYSRKIGADGQPLASSQKITNDPSVPYYGFTAAYAPVTSTETPSGRYLVAKYPVSLLMLDSDGKPLNTMYNPQQGYSFPSVPLETGSTTGGEYHVDIAYGDTSGYSMWGKAFLVVWSDANNTWHGSDWIGIWGGYVDAAKIDYMTTDVVKDQAFPISYIPKHWSYSTYVESWRPVAAFNPVTRRFHVAWRETPGPEAENDTKVNHIRSHSGFFGAPPSSASNVVLSAVGGTEDPGDAAIAASTVTSQVFVVWDDQRNLSATDHDIYGSIYPLFAQISTLLGQNVIVDLGSASMLTFSQVTGAGLTTVEPSGTGAAPPSGQSFLPLTLGGTHLTVTTTAVFQGDVSVRLQYNDAGLESGEEAATALRRYDASTGLWTDITTLRDVSANYLYGTTTHFSDLAVTTPSGISPATLVTHTDDSGPGTLRQAIINANLHDGADTIAFAIPISDHGYSPVSGVWTIRPVTPLPDLADHGTTIDGLSQTAFLGDTNPKGPEIQIDGSQVDTLSNGLTIRSGLNRIVGLCITGFGLNGILIEGPSADANIVARCYIGVSPDAATKAGNKHAGVWILNASWNAVGFFDTASANILSGNSVAGVVIAGTGSRFNAVTANFIGTNFSRKVDLGNENIGVVITDGATDNSVTGFDFPLNVVIMYNVSGGILVSQAGTVRNFLGAGCITKNGSWGIALNTGGNDWMEPPVITSVTSTAVKGTALARSMVFLYNDPGSQGAEYFATAYADASGKFEWNGKAKGPHVTAIAVDTTAGTTYHNTSTFSVPFTFTAVEPARGVGLPEATVLHQSYPNPFNPSTTIKYELPKSSMVRLSVYDLLGSEVSVLVKERRDAGIHEVKFDGSNLASGVYLYRLLAGNFIQTRMFLLLK